MPDSALNDNQKERVKPKGPSWCPVCGNAHDFPAPVLSSLVGCKECKSVWTPEELEKLTQVPDPRKHR